MENHVPPNGVVNIVISITIACYVWLHDLFILGFDVVTFSTKYEAVFKVAASIVSAICGIYGVYQIKRKSK